MSVLAGRAAAGPPSCCSRPPSFCCSSLGPPLPLTFSTSGSPDLDRALIAELRRIIGVFAIDPGFKYIYDASPNAFATPTSVVPGTKGTVLLGLNLVESELARRWGGVAVAGLCAHECGHIYQMQNHVGPLLAGPTVVLFELHADCLAGVYMGKTRVHEKDRVRAFATDLFARGDYDFNSPYHHGAPEQRVAALERGYDLGASGLEVADAALIAAERVREL